MLPFLDYSLIQSNPEIFIGYSDTTFLHYAIQSRTGLRTFYGPSVLTDFSDLPKPIQFTIDHFVRVLTEAGMSLSVEQKGFSTNRGNSLIHRRGDGFGEVEPLDIYMEALYHVSCVFRELNTPPPRGKTRFSFLSLRWVTTCKCHNSVSQFRNNLVDLALSGILHEFCGLVVGQGYRYDTYMQDELASMIEEVFDVIVGRSLEEQLPILMNVDFGHTSPILTLPINTLVRLDCDLDEFSVLEPGVRA
ncbi:hypothetical protein AnigIFM63604_004654 [Aspergillus niger]|uniref:LD-carboxypeptidase C-terminal domain-containing protein n=1 Tax=Aspergillus niger TaxID=5061 RepID=A0A9W6AF40_ASPNG|nr:hypothetical protein AnigIFM63604_004654 [Aspergillus niger]